MRSCVIVERAPVDGRLDASMPPDRETILGAAAELLDPVLLAEGFARAAPGHWSGTRFAWHEDVVIEVVGSPDAGWTGSSAFTIEIFAGVPRYGIGDPVPARTFARALDGCARDMMLERQAAVRCRPMGAWPVAAARSLDEEAWMPVTDEADLRTWLTFVAAHLPAAIARVRADG